MAVVNFLPFGGVAIDMLCTSGCGWLWPVMFPHNEWPSTGDAKSAYRFHMDDSEAYIMDRVWRLRQKRNNILSKSIFWQFTW